MTPYFNRVTESKRLHRAQLAERSLAERLRTLDALREREVAIRTTAPARPFMAASAREPLPRDRTKSD
jgi:hypothetical protein